MVEYTEEIIETCKVECSHCGNIDIHKVDKKNGIQSFKCNSCNRKFADNEAYSVKKFHDTIKQRYKEMRDFKTPATARITLNGFITHYNFFLEHDYLDGMTPAMKAGIGNEIYDRGNLIESAINSPIKNPTNGINWCKEFGII